MTSDPIILLPREVRLVVERILLLTTLPVGTVPAVRDVVLYSAASRLGGLGLLRRRLPSLRTPDLQAIRVTETGPGRLVVEGGGGHAWTVLPSLLDALGIAVARDGAAMAAVTGVEDADELRTAAALGARAGLSVFVAGGACSGPAGPDGAVMRAEGPVMVLAAPAAGAEDRVLAKALRDGIAVEPDLWWFLHHLSNESLSPDTPESRRHAGPVIVEADGRVIGRTDLDDETDFSLLTRAAAPAGNPEAA